MNINVDKNNQYYQLLTRKIIVLIITISIIPLAFIGTMAIYHYSNSLKKNVIAYQKSIVNNHTIHIDNFLNAKLSDIQTLADLSPVERLLDNSFLQKRLNTLKNRYGDFEDLGIIDSTGYQRSYDGPYKLEYARYSDAAWFKKAMTKDYYISDVFLGLRGLPHFIIAIKVLDSRGRSWIIRSTIDIEKFTSLVENIAIGNTGHAYILNRDGKYQTKLSNKENEDFPYNNYFSKKQILKKGVSVIEYTKKTGREVIYTVSSLKNGFEYLTKPCDIEDLHDKIKKAFLKKSSSLE